jgi:hypothetical protein
VSVHKKQILTEIEDLCHLVCNTVNSGSSVTTLTGEPAAGIITADKNSALSKHVLDTGTL